MPSVNDEEARIYAESIVEVVREPLVVLDENLRVVAASRPFYRVFRLTRANTTGRSIYELGNGQWNIFELRQLIENKVLKGETVNNSKVPFAFEAGDEDVMYINARQVMREDDTRNLFLLAVEKRSKPSSHTTERKLLQNEERISAVLEQLPEGVCLLNHEGRIILGNAKSRLLLPEMMPSVDPKRKHRWHAFDDDNRPIPPKQWPGARALRGETVTPGIDFLYVDDDGQQYWKQIWSVPFHGGQAEGKEAVVVIQDITERKRAEEELKQKTAQLEATISSLPDGYIVYDMDRNIIQMNAIAEEIFAYTSKERALSYEERVAMLQIQTERREPFPSEQTPSYRALLGETVRNVVMRIVRPHRHYWLSVSSAPIVDSNGSMLGAVMQFNDITERKEAENELASVNRELEAFSYSVSHDLRAPLHVISSLSSSLRRRNAGQLDKVTKEYLLKIEAGAKKMNHLINDIMRLSKIGRHKMVMEEIDFSCMVKAFAKELQQQHQERHIEIHIADDLMARGDAQLLTLAVTNLLRNAWKYTSKKAEACIEVGSCEKDGKQVFFIRDNGAGFPMELADSLFLPFKRLHNENEFPGTGIGLPIVQRVIKRHGGEIWAEGKPGKGATFYFTLGS